jgi:hypothetical protein
MLDSLCSLLEQIPGECYISYHEEQEAAITAEGRGVRSLRRIAPWAIAALREADFYKLDAFFKRLYPSVYSVPLAVRGNAGIPMGLVLGPSEFAEMFASFVELLIQHRLDRESLGALPLSSDDGTALMAYGREYHMTHYFCFRYWLEGLRSREFVAMFARRLLFTGTEAAYGPFSRRRSVILPKDVALDGSQNRARKNSRPSSGSACHCLPSHPISRRLTRPDFLPRPSGAIVARAE